MNKIIVVVDMQNDFVDGTLGSAEALKIVQPVKKYLETQVDSKDIVIFTRDTHYESEESIEVKSLPSHCVKNTRGHEIVDELKEWINRHKETILLDKNSFMSKDLSNLIIKEIQNRNLDEKNLQIEIFGLCTDICVISNALALRGYFIDTPINVHKKLCAGSSPEAHLLALGVMKNNLIHIV